MREGINYKVDTFNRGLKSNRLLEGIRKQQLQSTIAILEPSSSDKECLSQTMCYLSQCVCSCAYLCGSDMKRQTKIKIKMCMSA